MATFELYPSGDTTGTTDTAVVAVATALLSSNDTLWLHSGQWYHLPTGDGYWFTFSQNGQTLLLGDNNAAFKLKFVGKGSATTTVSGISINGKTNITIKGSSPSFPAYIDGSRSSLVAAGITTGVLINISNQSVWGTNNNIVLQDLVLVEPVTSGWIINSTQGGSITRVSATATSSPGQASHGQDWDAVAYGKPSKDWTIQDCLLDAYGNDATKHENCTNIRYTNCSFFNKVTLTQDNAQPYDEIKNIYFDNCTFYAPVTHLYLKRKDSAAANAAWWSSAFHANPQGTLSLSLATVGTGRTATFSLASLEGTAADIGKIIVQDGTTNTLGYSVITAPISTTQCTVTNFQAWSSTGPHAAATVFISNTLNNTGSGDVTYTGCRFIGDGAVLWGNDANDGTASTQQNYGTITITNCTEIDDDGVVGGGQMYLFPSGVTVTTSGNIGVSATRKHYVRPSPPGKLPLTSGINGVYSYPCSWLAASVIAHAITSTTVSANDEIIVMDGTYYTYDTAPPANTETASYSNGTGNHILLSAGVALTVRAKHKWGAILDGTNSASTARTVILDSSAVTGSKVSGFKVQNFTHGTNNNGAAINTGANTTELFQCWFHNISNTNGGAGVRALTPAVPLINECVFTSCTTTATGGPAIYLTSRGMTIKNCLFDSNTATGVSGGAIRPDAGATIVADITQIINCTFTNNTVATSGNGGAISGKHYKCINCTFFGNSAATAGSDDISIANIAPVATAFTGEFTNCIIYSSTAPLSTIGASGTSKWTNCNIRLANFAAVQAAGTGTETDGGGNIYTQDPLFMRTTTPYNVRLQSTSSPCYRTGAALSAANNVIWDMDGNPFNVSTPNMGAFSFMAA